jgi:hypothetical protein
MTTILYKDGQFKTEDGILFEDQRKMYVIVGQNQFPGAFIPGGFRPAEGSAYSIREGVEVVRQERHLGIFSAVGWQDCDGVSDRKNLEFRSIARIITACEKCGSKLFELNDKLFCEVCDKEFTP